MTRRPICPAVVPEQRRRFPLWALLACLCGIGIPAMLAMASLMLIIIGLFA